MNHRQRVAFTHPCRLAGETVHPRFGRAHPDRGVTSVLTLNNGWE